MSASPSVESCTRRIANLELFVLECGHHPDVDFRGSKQVGDRMPCIGCYKGLPVGTPGRPETSVSPDTQALLEANKPSSERCPGCGGVMLPGSPGKGQKPGTPARCAAECEKNAKLDHAFAPEWCTVDVAGEPCHARLTWTPSGAVCERHGGAPPSTAADPCGAEAGYTATKEPMSQALTPPADFTIALASIPHALDDQRPRLAQATAESSQALTIARDAWVRSPEALDWAAHYVKFAKDWIDYLDAARTKLTKPLLDEKTRVDDVFMPAIKNWRAVEADLKSKIGQYHGAQRAEQERVMRESAHVYQQGGTPIAPVPVVVSTEGVGVRETWDFEITNAAIVPREMCSPDPSKIEIARSMWMQGAGTPPEIPGIKFYKTTQVRVRR